MMSAVTKETRADCVVGQEQVGCVMGRGRHSRGGEGGSLRGEGQFVAGSLCNSCASFSPSLSVMFPSYFHIILNFSIFYQCFKTRNGLVDKSAWI